MPEVNGQYSMNPQVARQMGAQAAQEADPRIDGDKALYEELPGAQKDSDCSAVNVQGGVSSQGGCCAEWTRIGTPQAFTCGNCTKIKQGAPGTQDQDQDQDQNATAGGEDTGAVTSPANSSSPQGM